MDQDRLAFLVLKYQEGEISLKRLLLDIQVFEGHLKQSHLVRLIQDFKLPEDELKHWIRITRSLHVVKDADHYLHLCKGNKCSQRWKQEALEPLYAYALKHPDHLQIIIEGCMGLCELGPNAILNGQMYEHANTHASFQNQLKKILSKEASTD